MKVNYRSYYYPRVSGLERQARCEDPEYQRNPSNSSIYDPFFSNYDYSYDYSNFSDYYSDYPENDITPVNTFYPRGTVCYVDESGGW